MTTKAPPRFDTSPPWRRAFVGFAAGVVALLAAAGPARAESGYCSDLRAQIARAGADSGAARYRSAAARQQGEIARTAAYARSLGCDRGEFLFFGDPPPPQCGAINARLSQMRANLASLQSGGGDGGRQALVARYNAECRDNPAIAARSPRPRNFFEELFGVAPPSDYGRVREIPVDPGSDPFPPPDYMGGEEDEGDKASGGSLAVCVRECDGGYFPVSYSARRSHLEELERLCKALCPNAEARLYTKSPWRDIGTAVSIEGESYSRLPNALKFQKTYDPACGCKPPNQSWADALVEAERLLAVTHSKDTMVTEEQAEQLSRPLSPGDPNSPRGRSRKKTFSTRQDAPGQAAPGAAPLAGTIAPEGTETADRDNSAPPETFREVVGPDGVKRRVRVVAPTL
jgi:hypothetical protein